MFLCLVHLGRLSYLSLLFSGILYSVEYVFPFLFCLSLLFSAICKTSSDNYFDFLHFSFLEMVLITASCTILKESEVTQSCLTLCNPMDCSLQDPPSMGFSGVSCHFLLQEIFLTQRLNLGLPHCRHPKVYFCFVFYFLAM